MCHISEQEISQLSKSIANSLRACSLVSYINLVNTEGVVENKLLQWVNNKSKEKSHSPNSIILSDGRPKNNEAF